MAVVEMRFKSGGLGENCITLGIALRLGDPTTEGWWVDLLIGTGYLLSLKHNGTAFSIGPRLLFWEQAQEVQCVVGLLLESSRSLREPYDDRRRSQLQIR